MSVTTAHSFSSSAYMQALLGRIPVPSQGAGRLAFQCLMVFCMVTCMVTINWFLYTPEHSLEAFSGILYEYPLTFLAAICVRMFFANPVVSRIAPVLRAHFTGFACTVAMTVANVACMATVMAFFGTLIANGIEAFTWANYASSLPVVYPLAFVVNLIFVAPAVKITYDRTLRPALETTRGHLASGYRSVRSIITASSSGSL